MVFTMNSNNSLQAFLDQDIHEEMMTYLQAHGYLTALCICPIEIPEHEWLEVLFGDNPLFTSSEERQEIEKALIRLKKQIFRSLFSEEDLVLPCDLDPGEELEESGINEWCIGFMEAVFLREDAWFANNEEEISELLLPIMVGSKLFENEAEFAEVMKDNDLVADMLERIPELLTSLYLLCHATDEKPALLKNNK